MIILINLEIYQRFISRLINLVSKHWKNEKREKNLKYVILFTVNNTINITNHKKITTKDCKNIILA